MKTGTPAELVGAIRAVAAGRRYLDPRLQSYVRGDWKEEPPVLTPREREILTLLAEGLSGEQTAQKLYLSSETVRTHVRNATSKLGASTRVHAVALAMQRGEIGL
jgi:DNA-binding NarL/FixJ family response regulator